MIADFRERVNRKLAEYRAAGVRLAAEQEALERSEARIKDLREAQALSQGVAQEVQEQAHRKIADVVSRSLEAVFDEPYTFRINFEQKRGRTEAALVFERDGVEVDPLTASGGGVVDVAALALRLSCLLLSTPPLRRVLVLDEPLKFLSEEYRGRAKVLIESLAKEMPCQFIMVTHLKELECGKVIRL